MAVQAKLSNLQLELLKLYANDIPEEDLLEIKTLLSHYFADKISNQMDDLFEEEGWGAEKIEEWKKEHMRTPYKQ